ncbi:MAG: hypothetical protein FJX67_15130 [Alphaproteobacteria bacterium]|nr:hypothetical protein [Alphaproteobacteria bacterium]
MDRKAKRIGTVLVGALAVGGYVAREYRPLDEPNPSEKQGLGIVYVVASAATGSLSGVQTFTVAHIRSRADVTIGHEFPAPDADDERLLHYGARYVLRST